MLECLFNKVADPQACSVIKKRLQHRCFPVEFVKFLRTPFFNRAPPVTAPEPLKSVAFTMITDNIHLLFVVLLFSKALVGNTIQHFIVRLISGSDCFEI